MADEPMPYRTADTRDVVALHRALRRMAEYLAAVSPALRDGDLVAAGTIADLATEFADSLHRLHTAEAELLWPVLRAYLVASGAESETGDVLRVEAEAERLMVMLAEIAVVVARLRLTAASADRDVLADLLVGLRVALFDHLGDNERIVLPLAARYLTYAQWQEIGKQFLQGVSTQRRVWRLGAMLRECNRRDRSCVVRTGEGRSGRLAASRLRRAFAREFERIQDVLGDESAIPCPLRLTAAR